MPCAAIQGSKCRGAKNPTQKKGQPIRWLPLPIYIQLSDQVSWL